MKVDDHGIGQCWLATIKMVSVRQQYFEVYTSILLRRVHHDPTAVVVLLRADATRRGVEISSLSSFFSRYTRLSMALC